MVHLSAFGLHLRALEETDVEKLALEPQALPRVLEFEDARTGMQSDSHSETSQEDGLQVHIRNIPITYHRPRVSSIIADAVSQTTRHERLLVLGCGPDGLITDVRGATARCIGSSGPAIDLHCEKFGW